MRRSYAKGYRHYLMTRFSLPVLFAPDATHLRSEWLSNRCDLFERYCLPSVAAQEAREFNWILLISHETPRWAVARLQSAIASVRQAAIFRTAYADPAEATCEALAARSSSKAEMLITSRLDSDDAIAATYVGRLQRTIPDQVPKFLNFTEGYQLDLQRGTGCRHSEPSGPFISLVEPWGARPATVFCRPHLEAESFAPVAQFGGEGEWLMVFHGGNATTRQLCGRPLPLAEWRAAAMRFHLMEDQ